MKEKKENKMKLLNIGEMQVHLQNGQAFLYSGDSSDVLNIPGIEESDNPEELIKNELELKGRSSKHMAAAFEI